MRKDKASLRRIAIKLVTSLFCFCVTLKIWPLAVLGLYLNSSASVNNEYGLDDFLIWDLATKVWSQSDVLQFLVYFVGQDNSYFYCKIILLLIIFFLPIFFFFLTYVYFLNLLGFVEK